MELFRLLFDIGETIFSLIWELSKSPKQSTAEMHPFTRPSGSEPSPPTEKATQDLSEIVVKD